MKRAHILLFPLLAAALLVSACAGQRGASVEGQVETSASPPRDGHAADLEDDFWQREWEMYGPGNRIYFGFDSAKLRPDAIETSESFVSWLNVYHPSMVLMIEGHTDAQGQSDYNLDLGCRRARAARDALIERGIAAERLGIVSYGKTRPVVIGDNEAAWAQNRRVDLTVLTGEHVLPESNCDER